MKMKTEMPDNFLMLTDSYKPSHWLQYPPNTKNVYTFFESRGGEFSHQVFFGLQYLIKKYLIGSVVTKEALAEASDIFAAHFGRDDIFNKDGFDYILQKHGGRLPIRIKAVLEGTKSPNKKCFVYSRSNRRKCCLVNWLPRDYFVIGVVPDNGCYSEQDDAKYDSQVFGRNW
jgi:nicotinamide phosphoribosyltransferase